MTRFFATLVALVISLSAVAQTPYLVRDINNSTSDAVGDSNPGFFGDASTVFLAVSTPALGRELWRLDDGSPALVKDIVPGSGGSGPANFVALGGGVYLFIAADAAHGRELWRTDGTEAGTYLVKDINPAASPMPDIIGVFGGKAYLAADDGVHGRELWVSDGTEAGTQLAIDFDNTSASSSPGVIQPFGDHYLLLGATGIYVTDLTPGGTTLLANASSYALAVNGTAAYFIGSDVDHGMELWSTDGTIAGTHRVADINPGSASAFQQSAAIIPHGSGVLFFADDGVHGPDLWSSDGTAAGTQFVKEVFPGSCVVCPDAPDLVASNGFVFFLASSGLWRTDGTNAGTFAIDESPLISELTAVFSRLYFFVGASATPTSLRATDGTLAGTETILGMPKGDYRSGAVIGGKWYFGYSDSRDGNEPWISEDGTAANTHQIANIVPDVPGSSNPINLVSAGEQVFFQANDGGNSELWRSDGTSAGTIELSAFNPTSCCASLDRVTGFQSALYFRKNSLELWRSDGTVAGTSLFHSFPHGVTSIFGTPNALYFSGDDSDAVSEFWKSDGTPAGTALFKKPFSTGPITRLAGANFYLAGGLWRFDDTPESVRLLWSASPATVFAPLVTTRGLFFFAASTSAAGKELWRSDGSADGTHIVKDIASGTASSDPTSLTPAGNYLFFIASNAANGTELWRTDGTEAGTILLKDIRDGALSSSPAKLTAVGANVFFTADDGLHGVELWRSDGTPAGTELVRDIALNAASSTPVALIAADGMLYFSANDGTTGTELWQSDGTNAGTVPVADLAPGDASSSPGLMAKAGRRLFFPATEVFGRELYALDLADTAIVTIDGGRVVEGNAGPSVIQFVVTRSGNTGSATNVAFATEDLSATAGSDYVAQSGTLMFAAGETAKTIDVTVNADLAIEENESFAVVLNPAVNFVLAVDRAAGVIEDDDQRAELSVTVDQYRTITVTNAGPSTATSLQIRLNESPGVGFSACPGGDPCIVAVTQLAAGMSTTIVPSRQLQDLKFDVARPVGDHFTVSVDAAEQDTNPGDDSVTVLYARSLPLTNSGLMFPPYLTVGQSGLAHFSATSYKTASLASSANILTVSPGTIDNAAGLADAIFTLQAGNTPGLTIMNLGVPGFIYASVPLEVVPVGQAGKYEVGASVSSSIRAPIGATIEIPLTIVGRLPDGTRPTGTVTLLDANLQNVGQGTLDANGSMVLTRSGLPRGHYPHSIEYSGDASFRGARISLGTISIDPLSTATTFSLTRTSCRVAEGTVTVTASPANLAPAGSVVMTVNGTNVTVALTPTGTSGQSRGVLRVNLSLADNVIAMRYDGDSNFHSSVAPEQHVAAANCDGFATSLYVVTPCRVLDTRNSTAIGAAATRTASIAGLCNIPLSAKAVVINITAVSPAQPGFLALGASGLQPAPSTSTINYRTNKTRANNAVVMLPSDGKLDIRNGGTAAVHAIIDVTGYFQ